MAWALQGLGFFQADWSRALQNMGDFGSDFFPPDLAGDRVRHLLGALVETVQIGLVGTLLGALVAIPLAVLATRPVVGRWISGAMRLFLAATRTVPSILWALIFVVTTGLGAVAGTLGIAAYTIGFLGKLFYEAFEGVDPEVVEAVRSTGTSRWALVRHAVIPESANPLLSQLLFIFEYNVRASSILGLVGAGGIGQDIIWGIENYQRGSVTTALLLLLILVVIIDLASGAIRRRFLSDSQAARPA